jgi:hypothetical protein
MSSIAERLTVVREQIASACQRSGRSEKSVTLVGVTKSAARPAIDAAYAAGLRHMGENRVQEAVAKFGSDAPADLTLHLIGHLQTNKVRQATPLFQLIHSVDSERLIAALSERAARVGAPVSILIEVNMSGEVTKHGVAPFEAEALIAAAMGQPHVRPRGLMTVAPLVDDPEAVRPVFQALRRLRDELCLAHPDWLLPDLSMGMSNDFAVAIEEGATIVRVGRAIFAD